MDQIDMKLVNRLQQGLPLEQDPYGALGSDLGLSRSEVLGRIAALTEAGYIRRLGGTFDSRKMGYSSILIGAQVPENVFDEAAGYVNAFPGVTHNYRRSGDLNMWFTLCTQHAAEKSAFINGFRDQFSIPELYEFPNLKNYKLHVFFDMEGR